MTHYLIWSFEHRGWWKAGGWGYTSVTHKAGRFEKQEAIKLCAEGNRFGVEELMVPAPERGQLKNDLLEADIDLDAAEKEADAAFAPAPAGATPVEKTADVGEAS